jgi:hypothetical protein
MPAEEANMSSQPEDNLPQGELRCTVDPQRNAPSDNTRRKDSRRPSQIDNKKPVKRLQRKPASAGAQGSVGGETGEATQVVKPQGSARSRAAARMEARGKHSSEPKVSQETGKENVSQETRKENVSQEAERNNEPSTSRGNVTVQLRRRRPRNTVFKDTRKVAKKSEKQRNALDSPKSTSSTSEEGISLLKQKGKLPKLNTAKKRVVINAKIAGK